MKTNKAIILLLLAAACNPSVFAQHLSDSAFNKMSNVDLGNYYMKKSRTNKAVGYALLASGLVGYAYLIDYATGNGSSGGEALIFTASTIALSASNPILCSGSRYKGKAEMLLMNPWQHQNPSDINAMISRYKKQQITSSIIAWTMCLGGFAGIFISAGTGNEGLFVVSTISLFGSLPVWMNSARNKGRISILVGQQSIPVSYLSGNARQTSVGLAFPIGRK